MDWIAEPVNTASCLVMVALPLMFLATHEARVEEKSGNILNARVLGIMLASSCKQLKPGVSARRQP